MTKFNTIAAIAISSVLSIGSALADSRTATIVSSDFGSQVVATQTSVGSTGATESTVRQAAQPGNWSPIATGENGGH